MYCTQQDDPGTEPALIYSFLRNSGSSIHLPAATPNRNAGTHYHLFNPSTPTIQPTIWQVPMVLLTATTTSVVAAQLQAFTNNFFFKHKITYMPLHFFIQYNWLYKTKSWLLPRNCNIQYYDKWCPQISLRVAYTALIFTHSILFSK